MSEENLEFDILTLLDEDGVEHEFEMIDSVEVDGQEYVALIPIIDDAEEFLEDSGELVIMRATYENDEQFLDAIEDDEEYNKITNIVMERLSDFFEFDEDSQGDTTK